MDSPPEDVDIFSEENRMILAAIEQGGLPSFTSVVQKVDRVLGHEDRPPSHDGADSGIDVKHETPATAKQRAASVHQPTPEVEHEVSGSSTGSEYKPKIPYFNPDTSYLRLLPPHTGRQSSDQSVREKFMRLATASARQQMRARRPNSLLSDGTLRMPVKLITYHVAMESRPPLQIDMSGPTATTYSPRNKPLYETNAPAYSFGRKDAEKAGGGRKAWSKLWIRSHTPFTQKTEYELRWPSGSQYEQKSTLGPKQASKPEFPSHSIGVRRNFQSMIARKAEMPAANQYEPDLAKRQVMSRAPAFSMGCKLPNKTWVKTPNVPAPNVYSLQSSLNVAKRSHPAFTMCVQRRSKRHDIGPFATL